MMRNSSNDADDKYVGKQQIKVINGTSFTCDTDPKMAEIIIAIKNIFRTF